MPSLENIFDSMTQTFLTSRSAVKSGGDGVEQVEKDDEEMDVDEGGALEGASPLIVKNTTRILDYREMDESVKIFKHHELAGTNDLCFQLCG